MRFLLLYAIISIGSVISTAYKRKKEGNGGGESTVRVYSK